MVSNTRVHIHHLDSFGGVLLCPLQEKVSLPLLEQSYCCCPPSGSKQLLNVFVLEKTCFANSDEVNGYCEFKVKSMKQTYKVGKVKLASLSEKQMDI